MQRISVNLTNDCDGNQLNSNNDLPTIGSKNYALQKPFETSSFVELLKAADHAVAQGTRFCTLTYVSCKIIRKNYFIAKFIKMYSLIFIESSDPFIKNKNSVLPILIEKIFEQKTYFYLLKMRSIFFKEGNSNFFN